MLTPLWTEENHTQDSPAFFLRSGFSALLVATGFERVRQRESAQEFESPQLACLHRLIFDYEITGSGVLEPSSSCDLLVDVTHMKAQLVAEEPVYIGGCLWSVSACNNTRILAVPGIYRLHLNDATAVNKAQVWIELYDNNTFPPQLADMYLK